MFPLLRLPYLALKEIIRSMRLQELFLFSHCSKKARRQLHFANTKNLNAWIDLNNRTYTFSDHTRFELIFYFHPIGTRSHRYFIIQDGITGLFFVDRYGENNFRMLLDGMTSQEFFYHMMDLFEPTVEAFETVPHKGLEVREVMEFMMRRQSTPFKLIKIGRSYTEYEHRNWCYENIDATECLELGFIKHDDIKPKFKPSAHWVNIQQGGWLTMENVMTFRHCIVLEMSRTSFTQQDCDTILTMWINGEFPNLRYLKVGWDTDHVPESCPNQILHFTKAQLARRPDDRGTYKTIEFQFDTFCYLRFEGVDIFSNGGKRGRLQWNDDDYEGNYIELIV